MSRSREARPQGVRICSAALVLALFAGGALAQEKGMVESPCTPLPPKPEAVKTLEEVILQSDKPNILRLLALTRDSEFVAYKEAKEARDKQDWAGLCHYMADNAELVASGRRPQMVFFGDSITENWVRADPALFGDGVVGRGIGGQTSAQMLVRFHADVVSLRPRAVHIMAGTNDVAGNGGPTTEEAYRNNIRAMVEIARAHDIRVLLASLLPTDHFRWAPEVKPAAQIVRLNRWLRGYAEREGIRYLDYYTGLATESGALKKAFSIDGVHPNRNGYAAMRALAVSALKD